MTSILDPDNRLASLHVDAEGRLQVTGISGGGGGGAVTIADGADVSQGATTAAAAPADGTGSYSLLAAAKRALLNWATLLARVPAQVTPGLLPVDTLATVGVARQLAAGAASANTTLTTTARRITIHANGAAIRYAIGTGAQTASATSHYIASGERLDWDVPANAQIAVIRAGATDGVLEVSEMV